MTSAPGPCSMRAAGVASPKSVALSLLLLALTAALAGCESDDSCSPGCGAQGGDDAAMPADDGPDSGMGEGSDTPAFTVDIGTGTVGGSMDGEARRFLKIPYAKAPIGDLRWRAPADPESWEGVRYETEFALGCPQEMDQGAPASDNEDCLYLNVWAPEPKPDKAPVMLWIHGGGNFSGAAGIPVPTRMDLWYSGHVFAERHGVVIVTINYRLGPLGFFAHPGLVEEGEPAGNQGLLDQRKALEWVRDNIEAFGGDPGNVTIFGESAGSADVCYHVASPGSHGLFHRAIGQSGGCTIRSVGPEQEPASVADQMVAYGEALGCDAGDDQLSCMRDVPVSTILDNAMQPMPGDGSGFGDGEWSFAAVLDGSDGFLPDDLQTLFDEGRIAEVPYLLGANHDEGTTFLLRAPAIESDEDYRMELSDRFGDDADAVYDLYPPSEYDGDFKAALERVIGDSGVVCSTHDTARRAAAAGRDVYMYNFRVNWALSPDVLKAGHAGEISHVFGTPLLTGTDAEADAQSETVAEAMNAYWASFARTGDPNHEGAPANWPTFSPDEDVRLELSPEFPVLEDFRTEECAFWRNRAGAE